MAVTVPSLSSTTAGTLAAPGIGSGLDIKSLVTSLMNLEQQPMTLLTTQEASYQSKLSSLGSIKSALSTVQTAASALVSASTSQYSSTVSDSTYLTTTPLNTASPGTYKVSVSALAQAQKLLSAGSTSSGDAIGNGVATTLTFTQGSISSILGPTNGAYSDAHFAANGDKSPVSVVIDGNNNSLTGIRDAINAANAGVTASIINDGGSSPYRLTITSNDTGLANSLTIAASGGDGAVAALVAYDPTGTQNLTQSQLATNAALTVDGIPVTSDSNTVSDAIQGVQINLTKVHTNPLTDFTSVTVQRDSSGLNPAVSALLNAYNGLNKNVGGLTAKAATFQGDSGVLEMQSKVRQILAGTQNTGNASYAMLSQLGISFQKDGSLAVDSAVFNNAVAANPSAAAAFTAALGNAVNAAAANLLGSTGPIQSKTDGLNSNIKSVQAREATLQTRLDVLQAHYTKQFSDLDVLLGQMQQTSTYLTQQLASLYNPNAKTS